VTVRKCEPMAARRAGCLGSSFHLASAARSYALKGEITRVTVVTIVATALFNYKKTLTQPRTLNHNQALPTFLPTTTRDPDMRLVQSAHHAIQKTKFGNDERGTCVTCASTLLVSNSRSKQTTSAHFEDGRRRLNHRRHTLSQANTFESTCVT
jgi:hypothetical protein